MGIVQRKEYNILLLGQTGTGKSTFINGLYNYMSFESLDHVLKNGEAKYCIPTPFQWFTNSKSYTINLPHGEDDCESQEIGQSATQYIRSYLFEFGNIAIRIIDTPGFGDTKGMNSDEQICENLINFLSVRTELLHLHGIIFVFKPNDTRLTTFFRYCMEHIFSKLHKDASKNISVVFTHSKGENYRPGPTLTLLREVIGNLQDVNIELSKSNIFCVENDCIKFLLTKFYNDDNLTLDDETELYQLPWKYSSDACVRLIQYIKQLAPHSVKDTVSINVARNYSVKLNNHLSDILPNIENEIKCCITIEQKIRDCKNDVEKLKEVLYTRTETKREGIWHVVCQNKKCSKKKTDGESACCPNCKAITMSFCHESRFWKNTCKICDCNMLEHVFVNKNDFVDVKLDKNHKVEIEMNNKQEFINRTKLEAFAMKINIKKYKAERDYINYWRGQLTRYLDQTTIYSDQKRNEDENTDYDIGDEEMKFPEDMDKMLTKLSDLEMTGKNIKKLFERDNIQLSKEKVYCIDSVPNKWIDAIQKTI